MRISDWSSDVCSSDLSTAIMRIFNRFGRRDNIHHARIKVVVKNWGLEKFRDAVEAEYQRILGSDEAGTLKLLPEDIDYMRSFFPKPAYRPVEQVGTDRSEEHTSELQSLMRISYAVFCLKKKKK